MNNGSTSPLALLSPMYGRTPCRQTIPTCGSRITSSGRSARLASSWRRDIAAMVARTDAERAVVSNATHLITVKLWPELGDLLGRDDEA